MVTQKPYPASYLQKPYPASILVARAFVQKIGPFANNVHCSANRGVIMWTVVHIM